ncbi:MAG: 23S rRNA (adenine(2503)-C(2))-methyltransferase RlmN, partial [SAR324 cluster bacterium]|nr:23S rRNA (adenine(2503)-C(2))-methyltransferase RlmN [SAR324 cluster bacterium]
MTKLYNIKNLTRHNLREWMNKKAKTKTQVQAFRADQIFYWLYQRRVGSFAEMHNL